MNPSDVANSLARVFASIVPEALLLLTVCILFIGATFRGNRHLWGAVALVGLAAAGAATWVTAVNVPTIEHRQESLVQDWPSLTEVEQAEQFAAIQTTVFTSSLLPSRLALLTRIMALAAGAVLVLFSWNEVSDRHAAEFHACLLVIVMGLSLTGAANELVTLFLALEFISIPTYVLLYLQRTDRPAQEAAAKYFLLSIFASGLLLFGFSYLYGMGGTTNIPALLDGLGHESLPPYRLRNPSQLPLLALVALIMIVAGLGFKITAVPFHFYAPDVYQGTTPSAAAILAFMPKAAGFVALIRVLGFVRPEDTLSLVLGQGAGPGVSPGRPGAGAVFHPFGHDDDRRQHLGASPGQCQAAARLLQRRPRRLHADWLGGGADLSYAPNYLRGNPTVGGVDAVLFYLVAYGAMTVGAFAILSYLSTTERPIETVDDLAGLTISHPVVAIIMAVFLFSLIGMPFTAGFAGKFLLFFGALAVPAESQLADHAVLFRVLALIGAINAAIGAWYYLRLVMVMFLRTPVKPIDNPRTWPGLTAIGICAVLTLLFGIYPRTHGRRGAGGGLPQPAGGTAGNAITDPHGTCPLYPWTWPPAPRWNSIRPR